MGKKVGIPQSERAHRSSAWLCTPKDDEEDDEKVKTNDRDRREGSEEEENGQLGGWMGCKVRACETSAADMTGFGRENWQKILKLKHYNYHGKILTIGSFMLAKRGNKISSFKEKCHFILIKAKTEKGILRIKRESLRCLKFKNVQQFQQKHEHTSERKQNHFEILNYSEKINKILNSNLRPSLLPVCTIIHLVILVPSIRKTFFYRNSGSTSVFGVIGHRYPYHIHRRIFEKWGPA